MTIIIGAMVLYGLVVVVLLGDSEIATSGGTVNDVYGGNTGSGAHHQ